MKKSILLGIACLLIAAVTNGQDKETTRALKDFDKYSYDAAAVEIEDLSRKTPEMKRKLAESYVNTQQYRQAERVYVDIMESEAKTAEDLRNYAEVLLRNRKYSLAQQVMEAFYELSPDDHRAQAFHRDPGYFSDLQVDKAQFEVHNLDINSVQEDFGTTYYKDKVVFSSSREGVKPIRRKWNWNRLPFLDMYIANDGTGKDISNLTPFRPVVNKKYHEGPAAFNEKGNLMIFTRNNYTGTDKNGVRRLKLFQSKLKEGKWQPETAFPANSDEYSVGHATLTPNGKTMYLASDKPGGFGGVDIYKSTMRENGSWTDPVNLGAKINTEGNEMFPFIHKSGVLIYASDGLPGLGGLDLFACKSDGKGGFGVIKNLGTPVNSNRDDFALILNAEMSNGYFSSNRESGKGDDDIYYYHLKEPLTFGKRIEGIARDTEGNKLSGAEVVLQDGEGNPLETVTTGDDGAFTFSVEPDSNYGIRGSRDKYFDGTSNTDTHGPDDVITADVVLEKDPGFSIYGLIADETSGEPLTDVKVTLMDNLGGGNDEFTTGAAGDFRKPLVGKRINDRITYNLKLEKEGYLSKTITYNKLLDRPGQYDVHEDLDVSLTKIEVGMDLGAAIDINPIYFDVNKHDIRPDAALELEKIVAVMNDYPTMIIELGSHTDCRASETYNLSLSDRRAKASAAWVKNKIAGADRIYGKGYGESQLVNHCACGRTDLNNRICSEEEHQMNRRTEFRIVKM